MPPNNIDLDGTGIFRDYTSNSGTIRDGIFSDLAINTAAGIVAQSAAFSGAAQNAGEVQGAATFEENSSNTGTVDGDAVFNDTTINSGTIAGDATFKEFSSNIGNVQGDAFVAESATNTGTVGGSVSVYMDPSATPTVTPTNTQTPTQTTTPTNTPSFTPTKTNTPTPSITLTSTATPSVTPTHTATPTMSLTPSPTPSAILDTYFANNVMLLNGDGQRNFDSNTFFIDSSFAPASITNTAVAQGSFNPYGPNGWSAYYNGEYSNTYIPDASAPILGSGQTTLEMWIYPTNFDDTLGYGGSYPTKTLISNWAGGYSDNNRWMMYIEPNTGRTSSNLKLIYVRSGVADTILTTPSEGINLNTWSHVAVVIDAATVASTNVKLFINGVMTEFTNQNFTGQTGKFSGYHVGYNVGNSSAYNGAFEGYMSDVRITKQAVYTSAFTPPTSRLTTTSQGCTASNVLYLTHQDSYLVDNSLTALTYESLINPYATTIPFFQPVSPYSPSQVIDSDAYGGSGYFNGSNYLQMPSTFNTALSGLGVGKTTIEAWIYAQSWNTGVGAIVIMGNNRAVAQSNKWTFGAGSSSLTSNTGVLFMNYSTSPTTEANMTTTTLTLPRNAWAHVALVIDATTPSNTTVDFYVNGVRERFTGKNFTAQSSVYGTPTIGGNSYGVDYLIGYISNFRVTKDAVYTDTFTPSTSLLTTSSQGVTSSTVKLLTLQNPDTIVDNSAANHTISNSGVRAYRSNPVAPYIEYDPVIYGGSAYFNGASKLAIPANSNLAFGTGAFTIDFWVNPSRSTTNNSVINIGTLHDVWIAIDSLTVRADIWPTGASAALRLTSAAIPLNGWTHVAFVREGTGTNQTKLYINGVLSAQGTNTSNLTSTAVSYVGSSASASNYLMGYITSLRVVKGSALYTGAFTPPSVAPNATDTNTSLLLKFGNAGIYDSADRCVLTVTGNTAISTAKYGPGSLYFDGTGDYLSTPNSDLFEFGTEDFTIEFWWYFTSTYTAGRGPCMGQKRGDAYGGWMIYRDSATANASKLSIRLAGQSGAGNTSYPTTITPTINTWQHWAVVRSGDTLTWYCDGTACGSFTGVSTNIADTDTTTPMYVGYTATGPYTIPASYIDDLRITKGKARYTSAFTPPAAALPRQ